MKKVIYRNSAWTYFVLSLMTIFVSACSKNDDYSPMDASTESRGILISCLDKDGKSLLTDKSFTKDISAYGNESKKKLSCQIKEVQGKLYISFTADLPDRQNMQFSEDKKQATSTTQIKLKVNKQELTLKCFFKYTDSFRPPMVGGTSIVIEKISCGQKSVQRSNHTTIGGNLVISLQMDKDGKLQ